MTTPLTVIMPVRNAEQYLEQALQSLRDQTITGFAVHVWDDGSDDDTAAILKRWLPDRLTGQVIGRECIGIGPALARLIESSPTEQIARMDADDVCHPERFAKQLAYLAAHPDTALLGTQMQRTDNATGKPISTTEHPTTDAELRWQMRLVNPINHPTAMMRRSAVLACGNYRDLRPGQDDDLWLRLAERHRIANLPDCLLTYREHASSITANQDDGTRAFRARRMADAARVFAGLAPNQAQRLTHLLTHPDELGVTRQDIASHEQAAEQLALASGEARDYFKQTRAHREQRLNLRTRRLKGAPLVGKAWPIIKRGWRIARPSRKPQHASPQTQTTGGAAWANHV